MANAEEDHREKQGMLQFLMEDEVTIQNYLTQCLTKLIDSNTLMLLATEGNYLGILLMLLKREPSLINARDSQLRTPLHIASKYNNIQTMKVLLYYGADISAKSANHWEPLHTAIRWDSTEAVSLLIEHGANVNAATIHGNTPLILLVMKKKNNNAQEEREEEEDDEEAYERPDARVVPQDNVEPQGDVEDEVTQRMARNLRRMADAFELENLVHAEGIQQHRGRNRWRRSGLAARTLNRTRRHAAALLRRNFVFSSVSKLSQGLTRCLSSNKLKAAMFHLTFNSSMINQEIVGAYALMELVVWKRGP